MTIKRDGECASCSVPLMAGSRAQWDSVAKTVTCLACVETTLAPAGEPVAIDPAVQLGAEIGAVDDRLPDDQPPIAAELPPIDVGTAGASAQKEFERRHAKREQQMDAKWGTGRIGRFAKFMSDDPQTTTAWKQGARGEELVAQVLSKQLGERAVLLHDRIVPKTRGNIDHLAIAPSGVWIIDAKKYRGKVEKRDVGGWFKTDVRLFVGGRDRSKSVDGLQWQNDAVRTALGDEDVPVHSSLSFVGAEWPMFFAKPFQLKGVWISWPKKLAELVLADGPLSEGDVDRIARLLSSKLPAN